MEGPQVYQQQHQFRTAPMPQDMENPEMGGAGDFGYHKSPGEKIEFLNLPYTFTKQNLIDLVGKYNGFRGAWMNGAKGMAIFDTRELADDCVKSLRIPPILDHEICVRICVPPVNEWQGQPPYFQNTGYPQGPGMAYNSNQGNNMGYNNYYQKQRPMMDDGFRQKREPYGQPRDYGYDRGQFMDGGANVNRYNTMNTGRPNIMPQRGMMPGPKHGYPRYQTQPWGVARGGMGGDNGYASPSGPMRKGPYQLQGNNGGYNQNYSSPRNQGLPPGNEDNRQNSSYNNQNSNDGKSNDGW